MGATIEPTTAKTGAVRHLERALTTDDAAEKDFHLKQALQLLDVADA